MQISRIPWRRGLISAIAAIILMAGCAPSSQATATVPSATETPEPLGLNCIHQSGRNELCYAEASIVEDPVLLEKAARAYCTQSGEYWCYIYIWKEEENVADRLPLSDAESAALFAKFVSNPNTGEECLQLFDNGEVVQSLGSCE